VQAGEKPGWKMAPKNLCFFKYLKSPKFSFVLFFGQILYKAY